MRKLIAAVLLSLTTALFWQSAELSYIHPQVSRETATSTPIVITVGEPQTEVIATTTKPLTPAQIEVRSEVVATFGTSSPMVAVVGCESHFRQLRANGKPLISPTDDVGVMQINIPTWGKEAKKLGLDIYYSEADNIKMGAVVYKQQGIKAWTCSKLI